jgi:hypothetical protein
MGATVVLMVAFGCGERGADRSAMEPPSEPGLPPGLAATGVDVVSAEGSREGEGWMRLVRPRRQGSWLDEEIRAEGWERLPYQPVIPFPDPPGTWWPDEYRAGLADVQHADIYTIREEVRRWWLIVPGDGAHVYAFYRVTDR